MALPVAVPTHFAKVILTSRPPRSAFGSTALASSTADKKEWSLGAFVLPNQVIPDQARLESFVVPVEAVESSAGLTLFPDSLKQVARPLCQVSSTEVVA